MRRSGRPRPASSRTATTAVLLAAAAVLVAACGSASSPPTSSPATSATAAPPTAAPASTGTAAPSTPPTRGATSSAAGRPVPHGCRTSDLRASVENGNNAMYHTGMDLLLTNISASTCVTGGFPGVSLVDGAGRQIGAAADRSGATHGAIVLSPGQHATSQVVLAHTAAMTGGCRQPGLLTTIVALRVYPPANRGALSVPYADTNAVHSEACMDPTQHDLTVTALTRQ